MAASGCELVMEVFASVEDCPNGPVQESGTIFPDGACHDAMNTEWLPGIYRAVCNSSSQLAFQDSGCVSLDACDAASGSGDVCQGDNGSTAYIYARLAIELFDTGVCYSTSYTNSQGVALYSAFQITGTCDCDAVVEAPVEAPVVEPPTPEPSDAPVEQPVVDLTDRPVQAPVADPTPVETPTQAPVPALTSLAPAPVTSGGNASPLGFYFLLPLNLLFVAQL